MTGGAEYETSMELSPIEKALWDLNKKIKWKSHKTKN